MKANEPDEDVNETEEVRRALREPIGKPVLAELVNPGDSVCIITSDITRPCPSTVILPPLIDELEAAGIHAGGYHGRLCPGQPPPPYRGRKAPAGRRRMSTAGSTRSTAIRKIRVYLGTTSCGTPVNITSHRRPG